MNALFIIFVRKFSLPAVALMGVILSSPGVAQAVVRQYTIVQADSQIAISGNLAGSDLEGQGGGNVGLSTSYTGTISADRTASAITFLNTLANPTAIDATVSGTWAPAVGGAAGSAPADYGPHLDLGFFGEADVAIRDLVATFTSSAISISSGSFDLSSIGIAFIENSAIDYRYDTVFGDGSGRNSLVDPDFTENLSGAGMISTAGYIETLTIPVNVLIQFENLNDEELLDGELQLTGQIVAQATLPPHPGDYDFDGDVDGADFVVWQTNFPTAVEISGGDGDGDGDVDGADFVIWQTNFPYTPSPGVAPVPEPASWMLLLGLGSSALAMRFRRRIAQKF